MYNNDPYKFELISIWESFETSSVLLEPNLFNIRLVVLYIIVNVRFEIINIFFFLSMRYRDDARQFTPRSSYSSPFTVQDSITFWMLFFGSISSRTFATGDKTYLNIMSPQVNDDNADEVIKSISGASV